MKNRNTSKDNTNFDDKVSIRNQILTSIKSPIVLDMFCGEGHIYNSCYKNTATEYIGLDNTKVHDDKLCHICDNEEYIRKNDISRFNVFDSDAYGNGWKLAFLCAKKTSSPMFAIFVTDGLCNSLRLGGQARFVRAMLDVPRKMKIPAMVRWHTLFVARCIRKIEEYSESKLVKGLSSNNGEVTKYYGLLFEKQTIAVNNVV